MDQSLIHLHLQQPSLIAAVFSAVILRVSLGLSNIRARDVSSSRSSKRKDRIQTRPSINQSPYSSDVLELSPIAQPAQVRVVGYGNKADTKDYHYKSSIDFTV